MATTMRGIAEQAGIEAASIYYRFASKEELVDEVMEHGGEASIQHLKEQLDALGLNADARLNPGRQSLGKPAPCSDTATTPWSMEGFLKVTGIPHSDHQLTKVSR